MAAWAELQAQFAIPILCRTSGGSDLYKLRYPMPLGREEVGKRCAGQAVALPFRRIFGAAPRL